MGNCPSCDGKNPDETFRVQQGRGLKKNTGKGPPGSRNGTVQYDEAYKIVLLGAGESGKSTVLKQLRLLHGEDFGPDERYRKRENIFSNLIDSMQALLGYIAVAGSSMASRFDAAEHQAALLIDTQVSNADNLPQSLIPALRLLWASAAVQEAFLHRDEFQLLDSCRYFMERLDVIEQTDWLPTNDDILRSRISTRGIISPHRLEQHSLSGGEQSVTFEVIDVGGQKNERRRWNQTKDARAVIFVVAISEFNQTCRERKVPKNRMVDTLECFEETFRDFFSSQDGPEIILFLNKMDQFKKKIEAGVDIRECEAFAHYRGELTVKDCTHFISQQFLQRMPDDARCEVTVQNTVATDQQMMQAIKKIIDTATKRKKVQALGDWGS